MSLPLYLWAGVPFPVAIATLKVCAVLWTPISAFNYLRGRRINWRFMAAFSAVGLLGVYGGVHIVGTADTLILERVIGGFIIVLVVLVQLRGRLTPRAGGGASDARAGGRPGAEAARGADAERAGEAGDAGKAGDAGRMPGRGVTRALEYPSALAMGFYEAILGSGNGIFFAVLTGRTRRFDILTALGYYFATAFLWVLISALLYIRLGFVDVGVMIAGAAGSLLGGWGGSRYARSRGTGFTRTVFTVVGIILGLKMMLGL